MYIISVDNSLINIMSYLQFKPKFTHDTVISGKTVGLTITDVMNYHLAVKKKHSYVEIAGHTLKVKSLIITKR